MSVTINKELLDIAIACQTAIKLDQKLAIYHVGSEMHFLMEHQLPAEVVPNNLIFESVDVILQQYINITRSQLDDYIDTTLELIED